MIEQVKQTLLAHKPAIIFGFLVAIIIALPQVYFRLDHKNDGIYQGIELIPDSPWSARAREVQDGHPNFGAIYYKYNKDYPYLFQPLGSMVVGYMGEAFSLDINNTLLLSRLVLSFLVFVLIYIFVFSLTKDKWIAIGGALLLILADSVQSLYGINQVLHGLSPDNFIRLSRPINPAMIYILLFGFLSAFLAYYRKGGWRLGILSALLLGLNFYNYFYTWSYLFAFGGILGLIFIIRREWEEVKKILWVYLGSIIVAIPYIYNLYRASGYPTYADTGLRNGIVQTHMPLFVGFVVLGSLILFLIKFPREDLKKYLFALALILAPFVTQNQQLLTGKILQPLHYHWFFNKPIAVLIVLVIIFEWIKNKPQYKKCLAILIIIGSLGVGVFTQVHSYYYDDRDGGKVLIERQKYGPVVDWLNANTNKEEVVFANDETSHITVIYTSLNVFYHRAGMYSLAATKERLLESLTAFYRLDNTDTKEAENLFKNDDRRNISSNIYGIYYRELNGTYESIPDEKVNEILDFYKQSLLTPKSVWIKQILDKYEVNYVVWDETKDPSWNLDQYKFLEKTTDFGEMSIYKVI